MEFPVEPIAPGYDASLPIAFPNDFADAVSLEAGALVAQFRARVDSDTPLFTARTEDTTITIARGVAGTLVTVQVPASATANMAPDTSVVFDFVRIDGAVRDHVPGLWRWPVRKAVTRDVG